MLLQIIDEEETQFMTNCPPAVTESTPRRRTSIQVFWTAPPSGSGCVLLKYVHSSWSLQLQMLWYAPHYQWRINLDEEVRVLDELSLCYSRAGNAEGRAAPFYLILMWYFFTLHHCMQSNGGYQIQAQPYVSFVPNKQGKFDLWLSPGDHLNFFEMYKCIFFLTTWKPNIFTTMKVETIAFDCIHFTEMHVII